MNPTICSRNDAGARFEYFSPGSATLRTVFVEQTPFIIGRGETTELQVASTSVSREHAQLIKQGAGYRLLDLGSTNGTSINGQPITDAPLTDGDAISIADVELTFCCTSVGRLQRIVTQPLGAREENFDPVDPISDTILADRSLLEALLWQTIPLNETPIVDRHSNRELARVTSIDEPLAHLIRSRSDWSRNSVASKLQQLAWRLMTTQATARQSVVTLLKVESVDFDSEQVLESYCDATQSPDSDKRVGIAIPWFAEHRSQVIAICSRLRSIGSQMMIDGFRGDSQDFERILEAAPKFLVLDLEMVASCARRPGMCHQLELFYTGCKAAGVCPVLPERLSPEDLEVCADLGLSATLGGVETGTAATPIPEIANA